MPRWILYAAALAAVTVLAVLSPAQQPFPILYGRTDAIRFSDSVDRVLGLAGGAKVVFFEVRPPSACAASVQRAGSLAEYRGKEWVVRAYRGEALLYELRIDASLGFSSLLVNLSHAELGAAVAAAAELLRGSKPGLYQVSLKEGVLSVGAWSSVPEACVEAQASAAQLTWVSSLVSAGLLAILVSALVVAAALDIPGFSKKRVVAVALPPLLAACTARALLAMQFTLGKRGLAPTLRSVANVLYGDALLSALSVLSLLAGAAVNAKRVTVRLPSPRDVAASWLSGASVGALLSSASAAAFHAAAQAGLLLPLSHPLLEEALSSTLPWAELVLSAALAAVSMEVVYRYLMLALLRETTGSLGQAVLLSAAVFALSYVGYPLHPPYAKVLQALAVALALSLLMLREGLLAAVFANFTLNALSAAASLYPLCPLDAAVLALSVPGALPAGLALMKLAELALG